MSIFGRSRADLLKDKPEPYKIETWWKNLSDKQRADIYNRENPPLPLKVKNVAMVWLVFSDDSVTEAENREIWMIQGDKGIGVHPVETWKIPVEKTGIVREVRVRPKGFSGLSVPLPMYNKSVHKSDYIQVDKRET